MMIFVDGYRCVDFIIDARSWCIQVKFIPNIGKSLLQIDQLDSGLFLATTISA